MADLLNSIRTDTLSRTVSGHPADEICKGICLAFEAHVPGTVAGVTILDRSAQVFDHAIFPSLADDYAVALRGILVADKPGSCALAVFEGNTVVCEDIASDDRFSDQWKALGAAHNLKALVSIPAFHQEGMALGTFVVAWQPGAPLSSAQMTLAEELASYAPWCSPTGGTTSRMSFC